MGETVTTIDVLPSKGKQGFRLSRERIQPKRGMINYIVIHSKYFPDSDWLKSHV